MQSAGYLASSLGSLSRLLRALMLFPVMLMHCCTPIMMFHCGVEKILLCEAGYKMQDLWCVPLCSEVGNWSCELCPIRVDDVPVVSQKSDGRLLLLMAFLAHAGSTMPAYYVINYV